MPTVMERPKITFKDIANAFADASREGFKHDVTTTPGASTTYMHGPGGVLSYPGVDPTVFSTIVGTLPGLMNEIPTRATRYMNPLHEVLTGAKAGSGTEPTDPCDDAPIGGDLKTGLVQFPFGQYQRKTQTIDIRRLGQLNDRAEPMDLRLFNNPMGQNPWAPVASGEVPNSVLINEMSAVMFSRAIAFHRLLSRQVWNGNPANNSGDYKEFAGLSKLIDVNWKDAVNGVALPSLYPDVKAFGYKRVDSNGNELVQALTYMWRYVRSKASRMGMPGVRWAYAMREEAFYEITNVWPCSYASYMCNSAAFNNSTGTITQTIDNADMREMRDDMRANRYLLIDGMRVDVIFDDGITELAGSTDTNQIPSGVYASDIYLLALSSGGQSTLYFEYFDYSNPDIQAAISTVPGAGVLVHPGGAFMDTYRATIWCRDWQAVIRPRLIVKAPWLCGRLTNVAYSPLQHTATPWPDEPYNQNGGTVQRPGPSYYKPFS